MALTEQLSREVGARLEQTMSEGKWWYRIFESINTHAYRSGDWGEKAGWSHKGWGDSVISEINEMIDAGLIREEKLTQKNYIQSRTLQALARFYRGNFNLYAFTPYGDLFSHGGFPVSSDGTVNIFYKGVTYNGKDIFNGLSAVSNDVKNTGKSLQEIWEALRLVNTWYADMTTELKPTYIKRNIDQIGISKINKGMGVRHHITGHNPIALGKLAGRPFMAGDSGYTNAFSDFGMSEKYGGQGGRVSMGVGGIKLRGFESETSDALVENPRTHVWDKETGQIKKTIENPGLEGRPFLIGARDHLGEGLARLAAPSPIEPQDVSGLVEGINRLGAPFGIGQVTEERDGRIYLKDLGNKKEWPYRHLYRNVIFFLKSSAMNSKFPDVRQAAQDFLDGAGIVKELTPRPAEMGAEKPASSPVGEKRLAYEIVQKRYPFRMPHDRLAANQSRLHDDNNYRGRLYSKDYEFLYERLEGYINGYSGYHLAQDAFREMAKSMNMGDETIPKENLEILLSFSRRLRPPLKVLFDEVIGRDRIIKRLERFSPRDARSVIADEDRAPVTHTSLREYFGMTDDKRGINLIDKVLKEHGGNQPLSASASSPVEPVKTYETTDGQVIQLTGGVQIVGLNQDSSNLDKFYIAEESAVSFEVIPETAGQRTISIRFDDGRILSGVMRVTRLSEETHVSDSGAPYTLENFSDKHLPFFDIPPNTLQVLYKDDKGTPYFLLIYPPHARLWFGPAGEYVDVTNETHDFMRLVDQGKAVRLLEQVSHQNPGIVEIEKSEGGNIAFPSFGPDVHGDLVFYGTENYHGIERGVKVTITRDGKISKIFPLGITEEQIDRIVPVARAYLSLDSAQEQELKSLLKSYRLPEWPQEEAVQSTSKKSLVPIATGKELRPFSQKKFDRVTTAAVLLAGKYDFASAEAIGSVYQSVHSFLYSPQTNEKNLGTALDLLLLQSDPSKKMEFQGVRMMREVREKVARQAVGMTNATGWIEEFRYRLRLGISLTEAERKPGGYSVYSKIILEAIIDPQRYVLSREELLKAIEDDFRVAGELKEKIETKYPGVYKVQIAQGWEGPTHFMRVDIRLKADASSSPVAVEKDARRRIREIKVESVTEERVERLLDGLHEGSELFLTLFLEEWMEDRK